ALLPSPMAKEAPGARVLSSAAWMIPRMAEICAFVRAGAAACAGGARRNARVKSARRIALMAESLDASIPRRYLEYDSPPRNLFHERIPSAMKGPTPFLWFDSNAEEAVNFYVSVFK